MEPSRRQDMGLLSTFTIQPNCHYRTIWWYYGCAQKSYILMSTTLFILCCLWTSVATVVTNANTIMDWARYSNLDTAVACIWHTHQYGNQQYHSSLHCHNYISCPTLIWTPASGISGICLQILPGHPWPIILFHTGDFDEESPQTNLIGHLHDLIRVGNALRASSDRIEFVKLDWQLPKGILS